MLLYSVYLIELYSEVLILYTFVV